MVAGLISFRAVSGTKLAKKDRALMFVSAAAGALTYVALYMLKTFILGLTVKGLTLEATFVSMGSKLPASLINAVFATVVAPILMNALHTPLHRMGILGRG